ncbi:MAG: ArsR/SmtB family transcription factor [Anaerovoracaceae bacterium]|jgi:ArsR family transcriptional regulator
MELRESVQIFKALADETRLQIFKMISGGELCACKILENFNITQPTLSYHMKILTDCGLVIGRRDGPWMKYTINEENLIKIQALFNNLYKQLNQK